MIPFASAFEGVDEVESGRMESRQLRQNQFGRFEAQRWKENLALTSFAKLFKTTHLIALHCIAWW